MDEKGTLNEQIRYMILAAQRQGNRLLAENLREIDLTSSQAEVLSLLSQQEPLSLKELGERLICENGSPSRLVNTMVRKKLVNRKSNEKDARLKLLQLTAKGREKSQALMEIEESLYGLLNSIWTEEEKRQMIHCLKLFIKDFPVTNSLKKRFLWD